MVGARPGQFLFPRLPSGEHERTQRSFLSTNPRVSRLNGVRKNRGVNSAANDSGAGWTLVSELSMTQGGLGKTGTAYRSALR